MKFLRKLRALFRRNQLDAQMTAEMQAHVDLQAERHIAAGMNPDEARYAALRQFGNVASIQEQAREMRGWVWLEQLGGDLRHGLRSARKNPGFALVVIGTLALGIGINLAMVALINAILIRPLPGVRDAGRLVTVGRTGADVRFGSSSYPMYEAYRSSSTTVFSELAAYAERELSLASDNRAELVLGELVSANYFRTLGVRMALGRAFLPTEDEVPGRDRVMIISYRLWQERWAGDRAIIGRSVLLGGHAFTIVGVAEPGFKAAHLPTAHDIWVPLHVRNVLTASAGDPFADMNDRWLQRLIGRLQPGVTAQQASDHLAGLARSLQPVPKPGERLAWSHRVVGYSPFPLPDKKEPLVFLGILSGIALLVLAAVTINAVGLFLARALSRQREVAVRLALGASRGRLVRQMLAEGFLLATAAAVLGIVGSHLAAGWVVGQIPGDHGDAAALDLVLDWRLAVAAFALALVTALAVGLLPAWQGSRVDVLPALKFSAGAQSSRRSGLRSGLVVAQVALSTVLLICAGLVVRSLWALQANDPSRHAPGLLMVRLDPRLNGYDDVRGYHFYGQLLERVGASPGVRQVALAASGPFADGGLSLGPVHGGVLPVGEAFQANANVVAGAYFEIVGLPLLRGRGFNSQDNVGAPPVAVINRVLAERLWPAQDPLGQLLQVTLEARPRLVVGVVGEDQAMRSPHQPDEARPAYYVPLEQRPLITASVLVQAGGDPGALLATVRAAVQAQDPHVPLFQVTTLAAARDRTLWQQRLVGWLVLFCSAAAVALAMIGLYGALAQDVARRTREIGIRLAIGAARGEVVALILGQGMRLALLGLGIGLGTALGLTRVLRSVLAGVSPTDAATFGLAPLALLTLAALACWLPARRAATVDPMVALRAE